MGLRIEVVVLLIYVEYGWIWHCDQRKFVSRLRFCLLLVVGLIIKMCATVWTNWKICCLQNRWYLCSTVLSCQCKLDTICSIY